MASMGPFLEAFYEALGRAGVRKAQCDLDEARGVMVLNVGRGADGATRIVPVASLAAQYAACPSESSKAELLTGAAEVFGTGAADVSRAFEACGDRLLPQLWPAQKIVGLQISLADVDELPHCGLHGATLRDGPAAADDEGPLGVVLVHEFVWSSEASGGLSLPVETPVLSSDLKRWDVGFATALARALDNLRSRTKSGPPPEKRWEHHASGCAQSTWSDRFDAARAALLPALVAKRKRPDGLPDLGGHVVAFPTPSCALATMSKNALGLCFMGDTLHTKLSANSGLISKTSYRLLKMKDNCTDASERHPLNQKAGEGFVWRWVPYAPGGPPLRSEGEFSVPVDSGEVDAILNAAEAGQPVPVFTRGGGSSSASAAPRPTFAAKKEAANALFKAGEYVKAIAAYDAALNVSPPPSDAEAAVAHANAAQACLKLAEADEPRREACAAEALRRAVRAGELDPGYAKAHARCAAACELLGEAAAAVEFRARAEACSGRGSEASAKAASAGEGLAGGQAQAQAPGARQEDAQAQKREA